MKIKQPSAVSLTFEALMTLVNNQESGTTIPSQEVLSKQFDVSRTVLREALSMLLVRNILTVRPKVGTTINPRSEWLVLVPQGANTEIREVLGMFMSIYKIKGWEWDPAYHRAESLLEKFPKEVQ